VAQRIARRFGVPLLCDNALIADLVRACQLPDSGARNIDSLLDQQILPVLSRELLVRVTGRQGSKAPVGIRVSHCEDEGITVEFDAAPEATA
jgi:type VI secretion system protein VasG